MKIFSGKSNLILAKKIAKVLGVPLGLVELDTFSDGELRVAFKENIRGEDVFQSGTPESFNVLIKEIRSLGLNIELSNLN